MDDEREDCGWFKYDGLLNDVVINDSMESLDWNRCENEEFVGSAMSRSDSCSLYFAIIKTCQYLNYFLNVNTRKHLI